MGGHYRERIEDSRLRAVAEHVRQWLFGEAPDDGTTGEPDSATSETSDPNDPPRRDADNDPPVLRLFAG
jgi:hypothetical protein